MMKPVIRFALATAVAIGAGVSFAQEMGAAPAANNVVPAASGTVPAAAVSLATPEDAGPAIVAENQKHAPAVKPAEGIEANIAVQNALRARGFTQNYDPERGSIIKIGYAVDNCDDPKASDFMLLRELLLRQAELDAKIQIASSVRSQMSGSTRVHTFGTKERKDFQKKYADLIASVEKQQAKVQTLLVELDKAEANKLSSVTFGDQWQKLMDGIIKRIDSKYNKNDIAVEKQQQYLKIKAAYDQAQAQLKDLEQKMDSMYPRKTTETAAESFAEMKLCGTVDLVQSESWNGKQLGVAVAVVWSPKLQERALLTLGCGMPAGAKPGNEGTLDDWLENQRKSQEIAKLVGTRQFVDDKGRQYVLGFSAAEVPEDASDYEDAMSRTDLLARQAVTFYLFSEGEGAASVKANMTKFKGRPSEVAAEISGDMFQSIPKDFTVSGLGKVYSARCRHQLSGKEIYVSVAAVDSALAGRSSEILRSWYAGASEAVATSQYMKGEQRGMSDAYNKVKQSPEASAAGYAQGQQAVVNSFKPAQTTAPAVQPAQPSAVKPANGQPQTGTWTSTAGSDDF